MAGAVLLTLRLSRQQQSVCGGDLQRRAVVVTSARENPFHRRYCAPRILWQCCDPGQVDGRDLNRVRQVSRKLREGIRRFLRRSLRPYRVQNH